MKFSTISSLALVVSVYATNAFALEKVRLATHDVFPYHYIEDGQVRGTVMRQVKCAFNRMETAYRAEFSDWVDVELKLRTGKLDGIFAVTMNHSRSEFGTLSATIAEKKLHWYFSGTKVDINTTNPIYQKYKVAAEFGSDEWLQLKRANYNVKKKPRTAKALVGLLMSHEVDAILMDEREFEHELEKLNLQQTRFASEYYGDIKLGVLFSQAFLNDRPTFLQAFNTAASNCLVPNTGNQ